MTNLEYIEAIEENLKDFELDYVAHECEDGKLFVLHSFIGKIPGVKVILSVRKDIANIRFYLSAEGKEAAQMEIIKLLNELNDANRFLRFILDEDSVYVDYSFGLYGDAETAAKHVMKMYASFIAICNEYLPKIMRILWAE